MTSQPIPDVGFLSLAPAYIEYLSPINPYFVKGLLFAFRNIPIT